MTWTTPKTWSSDKITDEVLNEQVRDQMLALKDPPSDSFTETYTGSTYISSSSTTFTAMGANYSHEITTSGGDILVCFSGLVTAGALDWFIDFAVDGVRVGGVDGLLAGNGLKPCAIYWLLTDKIANTYTIEMQWKRASGGTDVSLSASQVPQFWVREVN